MRVLIALLLIMGFAGVSYAENFYMNNNPFPMETNPEKMNNIYETTQPAAVKAKQENKKFRKGWFRNNTKETQEEKAADKYREVNEGIQVDDSFVILSH